jgi:hypothetical protein
MPLSIICVGMGAAAIVWQHAPSVFAKDVAQHEELGRHAVQLLADLFADALEGLTAGAMGLRDLVVVLHAGQAGGQRLAHGLALGARL